MVMKNLIKIFACMSLFVMNAQAEMPTLSFDNNNRGLGEQLRAVQQGEKNGEDSVEHKCFWDALSSSKGKVGEHEPRTVTAKDFDDFIEKEEEEKHAPTLVKPVEGTIDPNSVASIDEPEEEVKTEENSSEDTSSKKTTEEENSELGAESNAENTNNDETASTEANSDIQESPESEGSEADEESDSEA